MEVVPRNSPNVTWLNRVNKQRPETGHGQDSCTRIRHCDNFIHLRKNGNFSDAVIRVEGVEFHVHRNILACCSDYFRALFVDKLQQVRSSQIQGQDNQLSGESTHSKTQTAIKFSKSLRPPLGRPACATNPPSTVEPKDINRLLSGSPSNTTSQPPCQLINGQPKRSPGCRFEVVIGDISPATMNQILDYAYGGNVTILQDNVEQLLTAADRFQIGILVQECCDFLKKQISVENCISIFKFASNFYDCVELKECASRYILENFNTIYQTSTEYEQLTPSELCGFLVDDYLNVPHEETVIAGLVKWVTAHLDTRQESILQLVRCARIGLMMPGHVLESFDREGCVDSLEDQALLKVMSALVERQQEALANVDIDMFSPRLPRELMVVIGGSNFGFPLGILEVFDCRALEWITIGPYGFAPRSYHGLTCLDNEMYVIGGFDGKVYLNSCCKLCPDSNSMKWESINPMNSKRCYLGVALLRGAIYAVGGYDGCYRLNSAEKFDPKRNQWSFIEPMSQLRSDAGVAVLNDKMYVCGGFSGTECLSAVEMYDPESGQWSPQPSLPQGRSGLGMVAHEGCLYAVGGFNGHDSTVRLSTMECYDPRTRQWTALSPMPHPRSNLAVSVLEGTLYAIGGYNGDCTSRVVECYDFEIDTWFQTARLNQNRSALSACVISGLFDTATLLGRDTIKHRNWTSHFTDTGTGSNNLTPDDSSLALEMQTLDQAVEVNNSRHR